MRAHSTDSEIRLRLEPEFLSAAQALDPVGWSLAAAESGSSAAIAPGSGNGAPMAVPAAARPATAQSPEQFRLLENLARIDWRPLPARWSGSANVDYVLARNGKGADSHNLVESIALNARSFIWQPWFVQLRGNMVFFFSQERAPEVSADANLKSSASGASVNASGVAEVFPTSRFPWTAQFDTIDSRAGGVYTRSDYRNTRVGLQHSWRSPLGDESYQATLNASRFSQQVGSDSVIAASGGYLRRFTVGILDAQAFASHAARDDRANDLFRTSARFSYRPGTTFTAENLFSLYFSREDRAASESQNRFMQMSSFATWRPDEDSPLFVTGVARASNTLAGSDGFDSGATTAGLGGNASYRLSEWASLNAGAFVDVSRAPGTQSVSSSQNLGASLTSPSIEYAGIQYSANGNVSAGNQTGGIQGNNFNADLSGNHQLSRTFQLSENVRVSSSVGQALGMRRDRLIGDSRSIAHTAILFATLQSAEAGQLVLGLNLGDSRSMGVFQNRFRLANLQLSGQLRISGEAMLSSSLTVQRTEQSDTLGAARQDATRKGGAISFIHNRVFNVRGLRYTASAQFNDMQTESRLLGDVDAPRDEIQRMLEQKLEYQIGLLGLRMGTRHAIANGQADHQFFFRVNRLFGNY